MHEDSTITSNLASHEAPGGSTDNVFVEGHDGCGAPESSADPMSCTVDMHLPDQNR